MSAPKVTLLHLLEATLIAGFIRLVRWMDVERASDLFGWIARTFGPLLPVNKVGDTNLRLAMPELDAKARTLVLRGVWDNLGRTVAEFPHLGALSETTSGPGFEVVNREMMLALASGEAPVVVVGGHLANWEVGPLVMTRLGLRLGFFYRAASNPVVDGVTFNGTYGADQLTSGELVAAIPEPGTWAMMLAGIGLLCICQRSRRFARGRNAQ